MLTNILTDRRLFSPNDGEAPPPPATDTPPPATDTPPPATDTPPAPEKGWWEDEKITADAREFLTKKGLLQGDATEALLKTIRVATGAESRLGKPADAILDRPAKDQKLGEYFRANAAAFGLPDKPEAYEPGDLTLPDGVTMDDKLLEQARQVAFEEGLPPSAFKRMTEIYAGRVAELVGEAEVNLAKANNEMRLALQKDWGDQMQAKMAGAQQAAAFLAEKAGLDTAGLRNVTALLAKEAGDAQVIKLFAAVADAMGEDTIGNINAGDSALGMTPVDARAKIAEYNQQIAEADRIGNQAEVKRLTALRKPLFSIAAPR